MLSYPDFLTITLLMVDIIFVKDLSNAEMVTLEEMHKGHPLHLTRMRSQSILLSNKGDSIPILCETYGVCRQTVSTWISKWELNGLCGLVDRPGRGRKSLIDEDETKEIVKLIRKTPRSLKKVLIDVEEEMGIKISISNLKLICKEAGLVWKRVRRSLRSKRDQAAFDASELEIRDLIQQHRDSTIDLSFFDESGFTLEPSIPYAWHDSGETLEIPSSKSRRINVLGFVNKDCKFDSFVVEGSVTSSVVVACLDKFADQIKMRTILIISTQG